MRLALALAGLLAASPAFAQRIDTRVDDVAENADGYSCASHAYPGLHLIYDWRGTDRSASWDFPARESEAGDLRMLTAFQPDLDKPFGTATSVLGFQLTLTRASLAANPHAAHLRVDGKPDGTVFDLTGDRKSLTLSIVERQRQDLAERLMDANIVEIDLIDASGAQLGRFSWDVRSLRRAPELLQLINWSCKPSDGG